MEIDLRDIFNIKMTRSQHGKSSCTAARELRVILGLERVGSKVEFEGVVRVRTKTSEMQISHTREVAFARLVEGILEYEEQLMEHARIKNLPDYARPVFGQAT